MFSSLLSPPLNSNYDPNNKINIESNQTIITTEKRILPDRSILSSTQYDKTIPLKKRYPNLIHNFPKIIDEEVIESTRLFVENLINGSGEKKNDSKYNDPVLPPSTKLQKNRHVRLNEQHAPIMKKQIQITKEEKMKWEIPAAISNWKNNQGFAIDLSKRMINQPQIDQEINIEGFGKLSKALHDADLQAREELRIRNESREEQIRNDKRLRDEKIKEIAKRRRYH
ncbi:unnamed protein product [Candida verbasci]|uniref:Pre-mRNA-processing protein 45 n=1 Tax=Candida verbasci TaxID=1227364 RepID=A0A9W4U3A3_9ASCO|nr:unnamed protein product [Candida verbasci]